MCNVSEMGFYDILQKLALLLSNADYSLLKTATTTWQLRLQRVDCEQTRK